MAHITCEQTTFPTLGSHMWLMVNNLDSMALNSCCESGSLAHTQGEMTTKGRESQEAGISGAVLEAAKHTEDAYNFVSYF